MSAPSEVWTIGHSTRSLDALLEVLRAHRIEALVDVRRFPGSRRLPQFGERPLREALAQEGIDYIWIEALGGRRRPAPDSPNDAWRNTAFRGYADHMASQAFAEGFARLWEIAARQRTCMMCAEVLWWRCHRSLICDALKVRGVEVLHIQDQKEATPHPFTSAARLEGERLSYRAGEGRAANGREQAPQLRLDL
ncbi:hypothetical protein DN824_20200 [Stutzerimonas nosocomialis]|uniref:DUF488 domain-containing protein n=1 Tax=Stutzerimonas nosocomialis TaxID=1056496 RepID=UPI0011091778|nr:DUF488 domain-containing protein [Stutzerimonas nosocomialis]TLX55020.1 hypothetical protein DN824_20200 [Stutzerimonas nosocomialis]